MTRSGSRDPERRADAANGDAPALTCGRCGSVYRGVAASRLARDRDGVCRDDRGIYHPVACLCDAPDDYDRQTYGLREYLPNPNLVILEHRGGLWSRTTTFVAVPVRATAKRIVLRRLERDLVFARDGGPQIGDRSYWLSAAEARIALRVLGVERARRPTSA